MTSPETLLDQPAAAIAGTIQAGRVTAVAVTTAALARIRARDGQLRAYTDVTAERALREAAAVDASVTRGVYLPLAGVPYGVKNLFDIEGLPTRAGSRINRCHPPARRDARLVRALGAAGAVLLGGLNMGEYAYDFTGQNAHDGNSLNPHDRGRMSGGSSGGSGVAVAAGMAAFSLGSDTNGSIRVPASFCGLFGLKPTYGRLSRAGTFPFCASLDHLGPLARSARDLARLFDVLQGHDPDDPAQAPQPVVPTEDSLGLGVDGLRIAVAGGYFREGLSPEAEAALAAICRALDVEREVTVPEAARARAAAYVITNAESSTLHLQRLRSQAAEYDPATRDRFLAGAMVPAAWLVAAQRFRSWFRAAVAALFQEVDILLAPATPFPALPSDVRTIVRDGVEVPARPNIGVLAQPISFIGLPVVAVPVWPAGSTLPVGVQVIAPPWREDLALRVAHRLEQDGVVRAPVAGG